MSDYAERANSSSSPTDVTLPSSLARYDPLLAADQEVWQKERQDHSPGEDLTKLDLARKMIS